MNKKSYLLLIIYILTICACNKNEKIENAMLFSRNNFKQFNNLKGEIFPIDTLWKPIRIWSQDSSLITVDMYCDYFAQIYSKSNGQKTTENIPRGIGPGELLSCWSLQFYPDKVWAFDIQQAKIEAYNVSSFLKNKHCTPEKSIKFTDAAPTSIVALSNQSFLCSDLSHLNSLVTRINSNGLKDSSFIVPYPNLISNNISENLNKRFWENRIYYNPKTDKVVIFYVYTDLIEIYNSNMQLEHRIQGPDNFIPVLGNRTVENKNFAYIIPEQTKFAYLFGVLTDSEIWTLYYGKHPKHGEEMQRTIFVFDYNGTPLRHYELDSPISFFCIDDKEKYIYGLSERPDPIVIRFKY